MKSMPVFLLLVLALPLLLACSILSVGAVAAPNGAAPTALVPAEATAARAATSRPAATQPEPAGSAQSREDAQGAVVFVVTPLDLAAADTLDFDVSMNTHSVDVSWDLARQSTLATDTGLSVAGESWPIGGGHHYDGTLSFPARTAAGEALLAGATTLTLTIRDTDVPERVFVWELGASD